MTDYKEIVTKAVISKGKRLFTSTGSVLVDNPSNVLGCWVINHNFSGTMVGTDIVVTGSYDVNIWYSYDGDTKTNVVRETVEYNEVVHMRKEVNNDAEVIVECLKQPSCVKAYLDGNNICYAIEKELGIELVGNIKVKIEAKSSDDVWDEIIEDNEVNDGDISEVKDDFIKEVVI